nr:MAG TPA: DNA REPAIR HELICASE RAD25, SSL2, PRE-INITIATION COMPLEX, RNA POLYMERASE.0A [Caudoviricetes sp.]
MNRCRHEWIRKKLIREYLDYSCFKVAVFEVKCIKCGKIIYRKYY